MKQLAIARQVSGVRLKQECKNRDYLATSKALRKFQRDEYMIAFSKRVIRFSPTLSLTPLIGEIDTPPEFTPCNRTDWGIAAGSL
jgi:hypothetical protein